MSIKDRLATARAEAVAKSDQASITGEARGIPGLPKTASPASAAIAEHLGSIAAHEAEIRRLKAEAERNQRAAAIRTKHQKKITPKAIADLADELVAEMQAERQREIREIAEEAARGFLTAKATHDARAEAIKAGFEDPETRVERETVAEKHPESGALWAVDKVRRVLVDRPAPVRPRLFEILRAKKVI